MEQLITEGCLGLREAFRFYVLCFFIFILFCFLCAGVIVYLELLMYLQLCTCFPCFSFLLRKKIDECVTLLAFNNISARCTPCFNGFALT